MASPATDVFVSYKAEDRARLVPLVEALEAEGFSVWWDAHIGGGTNWREDIQEHLDAAKCVIVIWSKRSVGPDGNFVRDEAARAQRRHAYVPIRIDDIEPPLGFGEIQALPLKGWKGDRADPRFQAVAHAVRGQVSGEHVANPHVHFHQPRVSRRAAIAGGVGVVALASAGGAWYFLKPSVANAKRIAVLPFANLSGAEDQAYFAEGIAEELRGALSRIGMEVIGRASSDAVKDLDTKAAAAKLGVANILTGSVRRSPQTVRISAQLVGGSDGVEHWAQSYDRAPGDEIKIQTDIATNVAQALRIALGQAGKAAITLGSTSDSVAQDLFLRARTLYYAGNTANEMDQALALVGAAIARDPNYAEAYRLKSRIFQALGGNYPKTPADGAQKFTQAETAARRAIQLAPRLGSAYVALAGVQFARFEFADAVQNVRLGLALSPDELSVIGPASVFAQQFGTPRKALEFADRTLSLDPLLAISHERRAQVLLIKRDFAGAIEASRKALELDTKLLSAHADIGQCLLLMNRFPEAEIEFRKMSADDPYRTIYEGILAARSGGMASAERAISPIRELYGEAASYQYAQIYAQAGNIDRAFGELDNAVRVKDPGLQALKSDPFLDPIRRDPRYAALLKRLNFPTWT